jgi:hypothetical protein
MSLINSSIGEVDRRGLSTEVVSSGLVCIYLWTKLAPNAKWANDSS